MTITGLICRPIQVTEADESRGKLVISVQSVVRGPMALDGATAETRSIYFVNAFDRNGETTVRKFDNHYRKLMNSGTVNLIVVKLVKLK